MAATVWEYLKGVKCGIRMSGPHILESFVKIPLGIVLALLPLYGIDKLIKLSPVSIPSSVICMLVMFLGLLLLEKIFGTKKVSTLVNWINLPASFVLRYMSIFFTPSFTLLPLAQAVSVAEAFEIAGVFVFGYLVLMASCAYGVWGLQKLTGTKRRPFSSNDSNDTVELTSVRASARQGGSETPANISNISPVSTKHSRMDSTSSASSVAGSRTASPAPTAKIQRPHNPGVSLQQDERSRTCLQTRPEQYREELTDESKRIGTFIAAKFDWFAYLGLFLTGIPIYFATGYAMPLHLGIITLLYKAATNIPQPFKAVLHPIIVSGSAAILFVYIFSLIHGEGLNTALAYYKTGRNYLYLFDARYFDRLPGAGDVLSTLLDVSIVALSMPMYNYRSDLKRHFTSLVVPSLISGIACFFIYPPLAYACGVQNERAMAFMARSVTLALALPIVQSVGGSESMISVVAILSGICGVLFGGMILGKRGLRIRQDDFVTRGITLGINSSAVASASLLPVDPRAGALSSLAFFLYGIVMVVLSAITPLTNVVRSWVDLPPI